MVHADAVPGVKLFKMVAIAPPVWAITDADIVHSYRRGNVPGNRVPRPTPKSLVHLAVLGGFAGSTELAAGHWRTFTLIHANDGSAPAVAFRTVVR